MLDPATTSALIGGASTVLGRAVQSPPTTAVSSATPVTNSWFDGSGWTVATGKGSAQGGARSQSEALPFNPLMIVGALLALVAWKTLS